MGQDPSYFLNFALFKESEVGVFWLPFLLCCGELLVVELWQETQKEQIRQMQKWLFPEYSEFSKWVIEFSTSLQCSASWAGYKLSHNYKTHIVSALWRDSNAEKWIASISVWNAVSPWTFWGFSIVFRLKSEDFLHCLDFLFAWGGCGHSRTKNPHLDFWPGDNKSICGFILISCKRLGNVWSLLIQL